MIDYVSVIDHLDALSRRRALTDAESFQLERAIKVERVIETRLRQKREYKRRFDAGCGVVRKLIEEAARLTGHSYEQIIGSDGARRLARVRFAIMKVAKEQGKSLPQIGHVLSGRDHSTVLSGIRRATEMEAIDPDFAELLGGLREEAGR